jgi:transglutaminase-like putative cysteine protease
VTYDDENGNRVTLISFVPGAREVVIRSQGVVQTSDTAGVVGKQQGQLPLWHFTEQTALTREGPLLRALVESLPVDSEDTLARLHALSTLVREAVAYEPGHTDVATSAEQVLAAGRGCARTRPTCSSPPPAISAFPRAMPAAT